MQTQISSSPLMSAGQIARMIGVSPFVAAKVIQRANLMPLAQMRSPNGKTTTSLYSVDADTIQTLAVKLKEHKKDVKRQQKEMGRVGIGVVLQNRKALEDRISQLEAKVSRLYKAFGFSEEIHDTQ